ncbi:uncharacterized protein SCHCODRAFT_01184510 [Schizophyllum commune H4-8]|nr:uncharacterized protein SCHCODRAFT_01184510 [Schizophyllum commune H4-8]KAI5893134.1 hypothetical protein SCHCODRAFT_01184510 [Schizophyllum commune H4-8]
MYLPTTLKLHIRLYDGPQTFVIRPARSLYCLVRNLRREGVERGRLEQDAAFAAQAQPSRSSMVVNLSRQNEPAIAITGLIPPTVQIVTASAARYAGFHVELAGGGYFTLGMLRTKVADLRERVTVSALYILPARLIFQLSLWSEVRREGPPIEGFHAAADVSSVEKAAKILSLPQVFSIEHVSFEAGFIQHTRQVITITAADS